MYFDLQKASMLKRISALILDGILIMILATGFGFAISAIIGYDKEYSELETCYTAYETEYGVRMDLTDEEYLAMDEAEQAHYEEVYRIMAEDEEVTYHYTMVMDMTLVILSFGVLLAVAVTDFIIPLILKNGQTVGKKIFGLGLMQNDQTKVLTMSLAVRTFLGKYTVEIMIPLLLAIMIFFGFIGIGGTIGMALIIVAQLALLIATPTNAAIHDLISQTVVVDFKSQMIFDNLEHKKQYEKKEISSVVK